METEMTHEEVERMKEKAREVVRTRDPETFAHAVASLILNLENTAS